MISCVFDKKIVGGSLEGKVDDQIIKNKFDENKFKSGTLVIDFKG